MVREKGDILLSRLVGTCCTYILLHTTYLPCSKRVRLTQLAGISQGKISQKGSMLRSSILS
jgi:hypothetical protein